MTQLKYTSEIIHDILVRAGEGTDSSTDTDYELYTSVLTWINRAYRLICTARTDWPWLRKSFPGTLVFQPAVTGTVTCTGGSATITFSTAPLNSYGANVSLAGYFFRASSDADYYRITAHTSGATTATIDAAYTSTTASKSYTAFKLEYDLASDVVRVIDPFTLSGTGVTSRIYGEMECISPQSMAQDYPLQFVQSGVPDHYSYVGDTKIRINRYPTSLVRAEYSYHYRPGDLTGAALEEPVMPVERRSLLGDYALAMLLDTISDDRADRWLDLATKNMANFIQEYEYRLMRQSPNMLTIRPRGSYASKRIIRSASGLVYSW